MSREKSQYKGDGSDINFQDIPGGLRDSLSKCVRENEKKAKHKGDKQHINTIVEALLTEARYMLDELQWQVLDITKGELQAEHKNLTKIVNSVKTKITNLRKPRSIPNKAILEVCEDLAVVSDRLKSLSPDYDSLFGVADNPLNYADDIVVLANRFQSIDIGASLETLKDTALQTLNQLCESLGKIDQKISGLEAKPAVFSLQHDIAIETAIRVMNVLELFEIDSSATYHQGYDDASMTVQVLDLIGKELKGNRSPFTWRDIIEEAKKQQREILNDLSG